MSLDLDARLARLDAWAADPVVFLASEELAALGRWKEALERARAAIRMGVAKDRLLLNLADGALRSGRPDRVHKALSQVSRQGRRSAPARKVEVRALEQEGRDAEARAAAEQLVLDHPDDAWGRIWLSRRAGGAGVRGIGPLETERRVRALADAGLVGRALRVGRRLRLEHPDDEHLHALLVRIASRVAAEGPGDDPVLAMLSLPELGMRTP